MKKKLLVFVSVFFLAALVFLAHFAIVGSGVWGDGQFYYSYLRSIVIDHDLNFRNELEHFSREIQVTSTGMIANKYSIGPAILWSPFFLLAHFLVTGLRFFGIKISNDGYSASYQIFTGLGSVFYGILGLWFCFLSIRKYFDRKIALVSSLGLWFSSNLFFYTTVDPINSHSVSFFVSSLVVYLLVLSTEVSLVLGFLVGLLTLIRNQDIIFVIPIVFLFLSTPGEYLRDVKRPSHVRLWRTPLVCLYRLLMFIFSFSLTLLPQLFVWQYLYGQIFNPYLIGGEKFYWTNPKIFSVLFSQNNGLFYYSPILVLSLVGLYYFLRKNSFLAISGFLLFVLQTYIISSWHDWHGGASFGGRMFTVLAPFFMLGLAGFLDRLKLKYDYKAIYIIITLFAVLNFSSIVIYLLTSP